MPAPFSPTMPWIVPLGTARFTFSLARTGPNAFDMPLRSIAINEASESGTLESFMSGASS